MKLYHKFCAAVMAVMITANCPLLSVHAGDIPAISGAEEVTDTNPEEPVLKLTEYSQTAQLNVNYDGEIIWLSGDTGVVTVENGTVTAVGNGSTVIYAICGDSRAETNVIVNYNYYLSDSELTLDTGSQKQLGLYSSNTDNAVNPLAVWRSSDTNIVTVDNDGILTAVSAGTAEITAKVGDVTCICKVTVNAGPAQAEISVGSTEIKKGSTTALSVSNYDGSVTWVSSDTTVITVSADGVLTGVNAGTATVYAMLENGKTLSYQITVTSDETAVSSGDVNEDSTVDIRDVIMLNQSIFGKVSLTPSQIKNADVNHDGTPDSEDSLAIMKYIVRLITSFN